MITPEQRQEVTGMAIHVAEEFVGGFSPDSRTSMHPWESDHICLGQWIVSIKRGRKLIQKREEWRGIGLSFTDTRGLRYRQERLHLYPFVDLNTYEQNRTTNILGFTIGACVKTEPDISSYFETVKVLKRNGTLYPVSLVERQLLESLQRTWEMVSSCKITQLRVQS